MLAVAAAVIRTRARGRFFNLSIWSISWNRKRPPVEVVGYREAAALRCHRIDELGYLPFSQSGGQLLFHLISKLTRTRRC